MMAQMTLGTSRSRKRPGLPARKPKLSVNMALRLPMLRSSAVSAQASELPIVSPIHVCFANVHELWAVFSGVLETGMLDYLQPPAGEVTRHLGRGCNGSKPHGARNPGGGCGRKAR